MCLVSNLENIHYRVSRRGNFLGEYLTGTSNIIGPVSQVVPLMDVSIM